MYLHEKKIQLPEAVPLFWNTNMAAVTSLKTLLDKPVRIEKLQIFVRNKTAWKHYDVGLRQTFKKKSFYDLLLWALFFYENYTSLGQGHRPKFIV